MLLFNNMKRLLIPFFTAGHPNINSISQIIQAFDKIGVDYIEVGLAHSDALADGSTIQNSSFKALKNGMNLDILFENLKIYKPQKSKLILFSYYNPLMCYGLEKVAKCWKESGGQFILIPDLPFEEAQEFKQICEENGLNLIFLIAPTSTPDRIKQITEISSEFLYLVSTTGITGTQKDLSANLSEIIREIKLIKPNLPVVIGFGINNPETAKEALEKGAEGVVVGSALVKLLDDNNFAKAFELLKNIKTVLN